MQKGNCELRHLKVCLEHRTQLSEGILMHLYLSGFGGNILRAVTHSTGSATATDYWLLLTNENWIIVAPVFLFQCQTPSLHAPAGKAEKRVVRWRQVLEQGQGASDLTRSL